MAEPASPAPPETEVSFARDLGLFDATMLGIGAMIFGEIPEKVARYAKSPVMIVQRYEGPIKSLVKRIMG